MLRFASFAVLVVCCCEGQGFAEEPRNPLDALEKKLHGPWQGLGPCDGKLILHADGTYERKQFGPAGDDSRGHWKLHWNALPPTLTLSEAGAAEGIDAETQWRVQKLNDQDLVIQHISRPPSKDRRSRVFRRDSENARDQEPRTK